MVATARVYTNGHYTGDDYYKYTSYKATEYVVKTRVRTSGTKKEQRPIEHLVVLVGGPFEQVGGNHEALGGSYKKMG